MSRKFINLDLIHTNITVRYLVVALGLLFISTLLFGATAIFFQYRNELSSIRERAMDRADFIGAVSPESVLLNDFLPLETLMRQASSDPGIVYSIIFSNDDRPLTRYVNRDNPDIAAALETGASGIPELVEIVRTNRNIEEVRRPIVSEGLTLGEVRLGFSTAAAQQGLIRSGLITILGALLLGSILAILTIFLFNWQIAQPLYEISSLAEALAAGDLSHRIKQTNRRDEIGQLQNSFNLMASQLEETLDQTKKLSQVASRTDNLVIIADGDGYVEWVNNAFVRVTGFTLDEVKGKRPGSMLQGPDTDSDVVAYMSSQLRAKKGFKAEVINYSKSGRRYWVALEVQPVLDEDGSVTNFIAIESDITERKKYENILRDSEERLSNVIDGALDAVIAIDSQGIIIEWNPQAEQIFGWSRTEVMGKRLSETIIPHIHRSAHEDGMTHYHATGEGPVLNKRIEIEALHYEGHHFPIELAISPVQFGEEIMFSAFLRDISTRKQTEEAMVAAKEAAEAADRAKSEFLANMSHEIRTPMNAVIGLSGLLLDTKLTTEQQDFVSTIRQSGDALLTIINEILDFSKIEAGRLEIESSPFELRQCIEEALDLFAVQAGEKKIELAYFIEPGTPDYVVGDVTRLRQVLVNLVGNAIKFTSSGEVVVNVKGKAIEGENVRLTISVRDTGMGIAQEQQAQLFKPFSQLDASTTRRFGGTGLGLVICKRLINMMNGDIYVESEAQKGTTFTFNIIVQNYTGKPFSRRIDTSRLAGLHILSVDDNATNHKILSHYLESWGMIVHQAERGLQALQLIEEIEHLDAAIVDVHMPEMDGLTLTQALRHHEKTFDLPIIILSSSGSAEIRSEELEISYYLHKPIKPVQLYESLSNVLSNQLTTNIVRPPKDNIYEVQMAKQHPLRILVAEDNLVNQKVAIRMLEKLGYRADLAANGVEALQAVKRQQYDLILMDIQMPEMDGVAAMQAIRADVTAETQPYIVALTAHALQGDRERYISLGMDDYVSKPIHLNELIGVIERCQPIDDSETSPIDPSVLEDQFGEDATEMLAELLPILLEDAAPHISALQTAINEDNLERLGQSAHAIKGAAATIGALDLAEAARALEKVAKNSLLEDAPELLAQLMLEWQRVESFRL